MKLGRALIAAGALLLIATAAVHSAGSAMVAGWLQGERQDILLLVWYLIAIDWAVVALVWLYCARRGDRSLAPLVYLTALIPAATAAGLAMTVGPSFFGIWMLAGAAFLAAAGAALRR